MFEEAMNDLWTFIKFLMWAVPILAVTVIVLICLLIWKW